MKKTLTKILSVVLIVVITLTSAPLSGFVGLELPEWFDFSIRSSAAATKGSCGENITWTLDDAGVLTLSGTGAMNDYIYSTQVPWYHNRDSVKRIIISDGITTIGDRAFYYCENLVDVTIPDSVIKFGTYAFANCGSNISYIDIPDGVISIGKHAFSSCTSLNNIVIPEGVTVISDGMFYNCYSLTEIDIPSGVTSIGAEAFSNCTSLEKITISPDNQITSIGASAFYKCHKLVTFEIPQGVTVINEETFYHCLNFTTVYIHNKVNTVHPSAFYYCDSLTDVYYNGTEDEWNKIWIRPYNDPLINAKKHFVFCSHNDIEIIPAVAPTCTATGLAEGKKCTACGEVVLVQDVIPTTEHKYESAITLPTCTEEGYTTYICKCGDSYISDYVEANGHNYETTITSPTCIGKGYTVFTCKCGDSYVGNYVNPLGHSYNKCVIEPTCENDGYTKYTCLICEDSYLGDYVDALGHTPGNIIEENYIAPKCTETGSKENVTYCNVCSAELSRKVEIVPVTGHIAGQTVVENTIGASCGQEGSYDEVTYCLLCDLEISRERKTVDKLPHSYTSQVTISPTCTESGVEVFTCSSCEHTYTETIAPTGHTKIHVSAKYPTCTENGYDAYEFCSVCDYTTYKEVKSIGHDYQTMVTAPTCTGTGSKYNFCIRCNDKTDITVIEATGHSYSTWILDIAPTCIENGVKYRFCASCDAIETASMNALGHDYSDLWAVDTPANCTIDGVKSHHCIRCDDRKDITIIPATGHFFGAWNVTVEPTCTVIGARSRTCELCDAIEMQEMASYGHNYSTRWTIDIEPTCLAEGEKSHHCLRCDDKTDVTVIPVSGHIFGKWYIAKEATMDEPGIKAHNCYNCDLTESQEIPKLQKYTATFIADGDVVAIVNYPEDATEINEPEVPKKNRYVGKWEEYIPENKNIVIYAEYTKIYSDGLNEISTDHTADYYSSTGVVDINLFASSPSKNIIINSSKSVPLDIVLVLDQSGSMAEPVGNTKRDALVDAVNNFNTSVYENAVANGVDHRIAIVGFGMGNDDYGTPGTSDYIERYCNTNVLTTGGEPVSYGNVTDSVYANAFVSVNANGSLNPALTTAVNNIDAKGATMANLGLEMAASIFANNPTTDRQRIVVFLTDGVPTSGSSFEYGVANAALENAYQLKDTYNATVYSVGLFDDETINNKNVNNFMNYVSSNYSDKNLLNSKRNETTPAPADYYMSISDTSKLSEMFTTIAEESVIQTGEFDNATIVYTVSKYFTLTSIQEDALRKSAIETLGVTDEDITITRNDDATTVIRITNIHPALSGDAFVVDFTFNVTANGDTRRSGTYAVNTLDSGILLPNSEEYEEVFEVKTVDIVGSSGIAIFTINGITYHIERLTSSEIVIAPAVSFDEDYGFSGWNVPNNYKLNNASETFDATLIRNEYSITWNIDGELIVEYYSVGDVINSPTVTFDSTGDLFICWDTEVPHIMPAENLTITALYDVHYHNYEVTKNFNSCEKGGILHYECQCGSEYDEIIESSNHDWHAISGPASEKNSSIVGFRCDNCGAVHDNSLEFIRIQKDNGNNKGKAVYELYFKNNSSGENEQPGETVSISVPLDQCFSDVPEGMKIEVYRVNDDGTRTKLKATSDGDYLVFETDHFSTYEFSYGYTDVTTNEQECHDYVDGICSICGEESVVFDTTDMHIEYLTYGANAVSDIKDNLKRKYTYVKIYSIDGTLLEDNDLVGTGATVEIYDSQTDSLIESYTVVLYGDVNGDGLINDVDKEIITSVAICRGTIENKWCLMAADTNHDGAVDGFDVIETDLQALDMHNIEQVNNSAYLPKDEEDESKPTIDEEDPDGDGWWG